MLTKIYKMLRGPMLQKVKFVNEMTEAQAYLAREVGFEALAAEILDAFYSYEALEEVVLTVMTFVTHDTAQGTQAGAIDLNITIEYPVSLDTRGAEISEWRDAQKLLTELLPISKMGGGALVVKRSDTVVSRFVTGAETEFDVSEYRLLVQALAARANHAFGYRRVTQDIVGM